MEIIINKKTHVLKNFNCERRVLFFNKVLSFYDINLEKNKKFYKSLKRKALKTIWLFLKDESKKEIKTFKKIKIKEKQIANFINYHSNKITEYCNFVKKEMNCNNCQNPKENVEIIYAFLAKQNGWSKDYIREMDELDLFKSIKEAIKIKNNNSLEKINNEALVAAFASGSKQAKRKIDELNRNKKNENKINQIQKFKIKNNLIFSEQELNAGEKNGK